MRNKILVMILTASTALAGCTMIPGYERPALAVADHWPTGDAYGPLQPVAEQAAHEITWQEFFRSAPLQALIAQALENNRDLRVAALNVESARALYRIQRADLVPQINAGVGGNRQGVPENASPTGQDTISSSYTANIGMTAFELDLFGRVRSMNERALSQYLATTEAHQAARIALIAEVANAYLAYLADRKLLALTGDTLKAQQESYDVIRRSHDMGIGSALDVAQAATLVETARANQALYTRRVAQDRNALALLVGADIEAALLEAETLNQATVMDNLPVALPSAVLLMRPDVRQAEHELLAANANIGAARAAFFPHISLTGSVGLASQSLSDLFVGGSALAWGFVPQITLPLFAGGRNIANLDNAEVQQKITVARYEKAIQSAFREVADELAARGTLDQQLAAQRALTAASQKAYDIAQARYRQGVDSHLAVLDAQRALYAAQQNEIVVEQQRLTNLVMLYKALGGGRV